jgi:LacI family transcriptional regulator
MKRVGLHEIARVANVSIGTVDRALHGRSRINEQTRQKVLNIAEQLGYRPHMAARALAVGRSQFRVGVCIPQEIHFFFDQMREGIFDEARRAARVGVELVYRPVPSLGHGEKHQLSGLLKENLRGLIVMPGSPDVVTPLINEAEERGVRVVCICSDAPESRRSMVVYANPQLQGRLAAELMAKFIPGDSEVAVITGMLQTEEHRQKVEGFRVQFAQRSKLRNLTCVLEAHESERESYQKAVDLLATNHKLRGIYVTTVNCLPVCRALREHGKSNVRLITTDLFPEMVPYFDSGIIAASIYQDPYTQGQNAVRHLVDHVIEKIPIETITSLNPGIVLQSNLDVFRELRIDDVEARPSPKSDQGIEGTSSPLVQSGVGTAKGLISELRSRA